MLPNSLLTLLVLLSLSSSLLLSSAAPPTSEEDEPPGLIFAQQYISSYGITAAFVDPDDTTIATASYLTGFPPSVTETVDLGDLRTAEDATNLTLGANGPLGMRLRAVDGEVLHYWQPRGALEAFEAERVQHLADVSRKLQVTTLLAEPQLVTVNVTASGKENATAGNTTAAPLPPPPPPTFAHLLLCSGGFTGNISNKMGLDDWASVDFPLPAERMIELVEANRYALHSFPFIGLFDPDTASVVHLHTMWATGGTASIVAMEVASDVIYVLVSFSELIMIDSNTEFYAPNGLSTVLAAYSMPQADTSGNMLQPFRLLHARHLVSEGFSRFLTVSPIGDQVFVGGSFTGTLHIDDDSSNVTAVRPSSAGGEQGIFVARFDPNGLILEDVVTGADTLPMSNVHEGDAVSLGNIHCTPDGDLLASVTFVKTLVFGSHIVTAAPLDDLYDGGYPADRAYQDAEFSSGLHSRAIVFRLPNPAVQPLDSTPVWLVEGRAPRGMAISVATTDSYERLVIGGTFILSRSDPTLEMVWREASSTTNVVRASTRTVNGTEAAFLLGISSSGRALWVETMEGVDVPGKGVQISRHDDRFHGLHITNLVTDATQSRLLLSGSVTADGLNLGSGLSGTEILFEPTVSTPYARVWIASYALNVARLPLVVPQSVMTQEDTPITITLQSAPPRMEPDAEVLLRIEALPSKGKLFQFGTLEAIVSSGASIADADGRVVYVPGLDLHGDNLDSFSYRAQSNTLWSATAARVTISVASVDDVPRPLNQTLVIQEDQRVLVELSVYDPDVAQGQQLASTIHLEIVQLPPPDSTARLYQVVTGLEQRVGPRIVNVPAAIEHASGALVFYRPPFNAFGTDAPCIVFTAYEELPTTGRRYADAPGFVCFHITPVNDPPEALDQVVNGFRNIPTVIQLQASDADVGDPLFLFVETLPTDAQLFQFNSTAPDQRGDAITEPQTYLTDPQGRVLLPAFDGAGFPYATFTFRGDDGLADSPRAAVVTVNIFGSSQLVPVPQNVTIEEDATVELVLDFSVEASVPSGDVTAEVKSLPQRGTLFQYESAAPGHLGRVITSAPARVTDALRRVVFQPTRNDFSSGSAAYADFDFILSDNVGSSDPARVSVTVQSVPDAPSAQDLFASASSDPITITLNTEDPDPGDTITVTLKTVPEPGRGRLRVVGGDLITAAPAALAPVEGVFKVQFEPDVGRYSSMFTFQTEDSTGRLSRVATVTVLVGGFNLLPTASDSSAVLREDETVVLILNGTDPTEDGSALGGDWRPRLEQPPRNGSLFHFVTNELLPLFTGQELADFGENAGRVVYRPDEHFHGTDELTFYAVDRDNDFSEDVGRVFIQVLPVNDPPRALDQAVEMAEDHVVAVKLTGTDVDGDVLSWKVVTLPEPADALHLFQLKPGVVVEPGADVSVAQLGEEIASPNSPVTHPAGLVAVQPRQDAVGSPLAFFTVICEDSGGLVSSSGSSTVAVTVTPVNDPPVVTSTMVDVLEDSSQILQLHVEDVDDEDIDVIILGLPAFGLGHNFYQLSDSGRRGGLIASANTRLENSEARFMYEPPADTFGQALAVVTFTASDRSGAVSVPASANLTINVLPVNDPPTSSDLEVPVWKSEHVIKPLVRDVDPGAVLHLQVLSLPSHGHLIVRSPSNDLELTMAPVFVSLADAELIWTNAGMGGGRPLTNFSFLVIDEEDAESSVHTVRLTVVCPVGLVNNVWSDGPLCLPCPNGAVCSDEGVEPPFSRAGYFGTRDFVFVACEPPGACPSGAGELPRSSACTDGYSGFSCGNCEEGFYRTGLECQVCASNSLLVTMAIWIPVGCVVLALILWASKHNFDTGFIRIVTSYLQVLAIYSTMQLKWSDSVVQTFDGMAVFNLDINLLSLECDIRGFGFGAKWLATMVAPLGVLALFGAVYWVKRVQLFGCGSVGRGPDDHDWDDGVLAHGPQRRSVAEARQFERSRYFQLTWLRNVLIKSYVTLMSFLYLALATKALSLFDCTRRDDGSWTLDAQPSIKCYEDEEWKSLQPFGVVFVALYVAGIPLALAYILFYLRPPSSFTRRVGPLKLPLSLKHVRRVQASIEERVKGGDESFFHASASAGLHELSKQSGRVSSSRMAMHVLSMGGTETPAQRDWLLRYGTLTQDFGPACYWWELALHLRKLLIVLPAVFFTQHPLVQGFLALFALLLSFQLQSLFRPFRAGSQMNRLESVSITSCVMVLSMGMLFYGEPDFSSVDRETGERNSEHDVLSAVTLALIAVCSTVIFYYAVKIFPRAWYESMGEPLRCCGREFGLREGAGSRTESENEHEVEMGSVELEMADFHRNPLHGPPADPEESPEIERGRGRDLVIVPPPRDVRPRMQLPKVEPELGRGVSDPIPGRVASGSGSGRSGGSGSVRSGGSGSVRSGRSASQSGSGRSGRSGKSRSRSKSKSKSKSRSRSRSMVDYDDADSLPVTELVRRASSGQRTERFPRVIISEVDELDAGGASVGSPSSVAALGGFMADESVPGVEDVVEGDEVEDEVEISD